MTGRRIGRRGHRRDPVRMAEQQEALRLILVNIDQRGSLAQVRRSYRPPVHPRHAERVLFHGFKIRLTVTARSCLVKRTNVFVINRSPRRKMARHGPYNNFRGRK